jgi:hypothetical protein
VFASAKRRVEAISNVRQASLAAPDEQPLRRQERQEAEGHGRAQRVDHVPPPRQYQDR